MRILAHSIIVIMFIVGLFTTRDPMGWALIGSLVYLINVAEQWVNRKYDPTYRKNNNSRY